MIIINNVLIGEISDLYGKIIQLPVNPDKGVKYRDVGPDFPCSVFQGNTEPLNALLTADYNSR